MAKNTYRVVTRGPDGGLRTRDFPNAEYLQKTHTQIGIDDCSTDLEIRGLPVFRGLIGPMPEGKNIVRYETPDVFEALTKDWSQTKTTRRSRRKSATAVDVTAVDVTAVDAPAVDAVTADVAEPMLVAESGISSEFATDLHAHDLQVADAGQLDDALQLDDVESLELADRSSAPSAASKLANEPHGPHSHEPHLPQLGGSGLSRSELAEEFDYLS